MDYSKIIKEVGRGKNHARDLDVDTARALYSRMLDGEVAELELGGILIALRIKGEGEAEMKGFYEAMQQKTLRLTPPVARPMPIVIPSYNGARKQANLTPLLAVLLHKLGFPVVVHGVSHDPTRVLTETIFELMGIPATRHAGQAQARLDGHEPVYIPVGVLCPPLENSLPCAGVWACATAHIRWQSWRRHLLKMRRYVYRAFLTRNMWARLRNSLSRSADGRC
jgi:anthranilate phosphoribosyltransferase